MPPSLCLFLRFSSSARHGVFARARRARAQETSVQDSARDGGPAQGPELRRAWRRGQEGQSQEGWEVTDQQTNRRNNINNDD